MSPGESRLSQSHRPRIPVTDSDKKINRRSFDGPGHVRPQVHMAASKTWQSLAICSPQIAMRGLAVIAIFCHIGPCLSAMYDRPAFVGVGLNRILPLARTGEQRKSFLCMSSSQNNVPFGRLPLKMDRKDGGADKISRPSGPGKIGNPNTPGGAGAGGERESEKGGAGVAVLTKPPETDKVGSLSTFTHFVTIEVHP